MINIYIQTHLLGNVDLKIKHVYIEVDIEELMDEEKGEFPWFYSLY
jgi:hypothetical protein